MPNYVLAQGHNRWVLRNYEGVICNYTEPADYTYEPPANIEKYIDPNDKKTINGVHELLVNQEKNNIIPKDLSRHKRRI